MSAEHNAGGPEAAPEAAGHQGGFRAEMETTTARGGARYAELISEVRTFMDRVRGGCPDDALADELIDQLHGMNDKLAAVEIDEWHAPSGTRIDLPSRGNITLPPFEIHQADAQGVHATVHFTRFHLGGNGVAHGGYVAMAFDDLGGMASAVYLGGICRTAYLKVDYRSLTPLNTPLTLRAWVDRHEGRKFFVRGTLTDGDRLCAELDSLFIALLPGQG